MEQDEGGWGVVLYDPFAHLSLFYQTVLNIAFAMTKIWHRESLSQSLRFP